MASEEVDGLFGELRSAVAGQRVLDAHEIAKKIYSLDRTFHGEAVLPYLQSHLIGDGSMTRDTLARLEQFKRWVREMLTNRQDHVLRFWSQCFKEIYLGNKFYVYKSGEQLYVGERHRVSYNFELHRSIGVEWLAEANACVLRVEWRDALWAVLDERGLI